MSSACWGVFLFKCSRGVVQGGAIWLPERPLEQGGHSEIYQVQHCGQVGKLQKKPQRNKCYLKSELLCVFSQTNIYKYVFFQGCCLQQGHWRLHSFSEGSQERHRDGRGKVGHCQSNLPPATPTPSRPRRRRPPPLSPGSTTWWSPPATTRCPTCPPSLASRSSPAGFFMPTTSGFLHWAFVFIVAAEFISSH